MLKMMIKVDMDQNIVDVSGADFLNYEDGDLLGNPIDTIIPDQHKAGHHNGFNRFHSTGTKKILGTWLKLPAVTKDNQERVVDLVLTELKEENGDQFVVAYLK